MRLDAEIQRTCERALAALCRPTSLDDARATGKSGEHREMKYVVPKLSLNYTVAFKSCCAIRRTTGQETKENLTNHILPG